MGGQDEGSEMKVNRNLVVFVVMPFLSGCVFAPGMKMSQETPSVPDVQIVSINADVLEEQRVLAEAERQERLRARAEQKERILASVREKEQRCQQNSRFIYVATEGDTLPDIAQKTTGSPYNWDVLAEYNGIAETADQCQWFLRGTTCTVEVGDKISIPANLAVGLRTQDVHSLNDCDEYHDAAYLGTAFPTTDQKSYQYRIGPRDILSITVWDHPELTIPAGEFRSAESEGRLVSEDGILFYPFVGTMNVAGKTTDEVRRLLTQRLSHHIVNPQLDVRVAAYRSQKVFITGQVANPGPQQITDVPLTVVDAVDRAGDVTPEATKIDVTLTRGGDTFYIDLLRMYEQGDLSQNYVLQDGDVLYIPDRSHERVFVVGEVNQAASVLMNNSRMTLTEALGAAGSVDMRTSNPEHIYVLRGNPGNPEIFHLNSKSPDALILGDQFQMRPHDVVFVGTAGVTRWGRVISQILPTASFVGTQTTRAVVD